MKKAIVFCTSVLATMSACSGNDSVAPNQGGGGDMGVGGSNSSGGAALTGGSSAFSSTGGTATVVATGGTMPATGGQAAGGAATTGGAFTSTGGNGVTTGGAPQQATGGALPGTGGKSSAGAQATGGAPSATGGKSGGGAPATGGTLQGTGGKSSAGAQATGGAASATGGKSGGGAPATGGTSSVSGGGTSNDGGPASAATSTVVGNGCTPPAQYENLFITLLGETQASSNTKLAAAWNQLFNPSNANTIFYNGPGTDESYVEDIADNDVRTEGQSYGMMIALQLNYQTEFDRLWTFAKNHMVKASGSSISSITWSVATSGGSNGKSGGAPDGDEWFAAALVFAHNRWGDTSGKYNYKTEAQAVLNMVRTSDFDSSYHLVRYYAGTSSNGTDGSYDLPAFYQTWACFDTANADFWNAAVSAGRTFFHNAADANGVIGDQSSFTGQTTNSSGDDKLRCVANIMSDHNFFNADTWQTQTYASEYGAHEANGSSSTAQLSCDALLGFGLPASSGKTFVQRLWSAAIPSGQWRYYDGTLYTIALLHASGAFHLYY